MSEPARQLRPSSSAPRVAVAMPSPMAAAAVGNLPQVVDLNVFQGDTFALQVVVSVAGEPATPADLAGYEAASQIRSIPSAEEVLADFTATIAENVIHLLLASDQTAVLPARGGAWDVQVTAADGRVTTLLRGRVAVTEQVTRVE
ncbi:MAG TPA: hypothetical protein VLL25_14710 [Acidimicrobiales bacterium]|nr:hypothetical protein [Acidimicrobiales bacterium]